MPDTDIISTTPLTSGRPTPPLTPEQSAALKELRGAAALNSKPFATTSVVASTPATKPGWQTTEFWLSAAALVLVVAVAGVTQTACISRAQVASGAGAGLNCEAPAIKTLVADIIPLAIAEITKWISGSGSVDAAGLKADLAAIKGDAPRCALDAAVAILTAPPAPAKPGAPSSAPMAVDRALLATSYAGIRAHLGWPAR